MIVSTGDPEEDQRQIAAFTVHDERIQRGMCPNGCGGMRQVDDHNAECLRCGFGYYSNGRLSFKVDSVQ